MAGGDWDWEEGLNAVNSPRWLVSGNALMGVPPVKDERTFCLGLARENALRVLDDGVPNGCLEVPMDSVPTGVCPGIPGRVTLEPFALPNEKTPTGRLTGVPCETGPGCNGPFGVGPAPDNIMLKKKINRGTGKEQLKQS